MPPWVARTPCTIAVGTSQMTLAENSIIPVSSLKSMHRFSFDRYAAFCLLKHNKPNFNKQNILASDPAYCQHPITPKHTDMVGVCGRRDHRRVWIIACALRLSSPLDTIFYLSQCAIELMHRRLRSLPHVQFRVGLEHLKLVVPTQPDQFFSPLPAVGMVRLIIHPR